MGDKEPISIESIRGAFKPGKRGAIVFENDAGTLETLKVKQGSGTFIGTCFVNGAERTRKFAGDKYEVQPRWERWQKITLEEERKRKQNTADKEETEVASIEEMSKDIGKIKSEIDSLNKYIEKDAEQTSSVLFEHSSLLDSIKSKISEIVTEVIGFREEIDALACKYEDLSEDLLEAKIEIESRKSKKGNSDKERSALVRARAAEFFDYADEIDNNNFENLNANEVFGMFTFWMKSKGIDGIEASQGNRKVFGQEVCKRYDLYNKNGIFRAHDEAA